MSSTRESAERTYVRLLSRASTAVMLAAVAAGVYLLAAGLDLWRRVAFVHDVGARRTPVGYGDSLPGLRRALQPGEAADPNARPWVLVTWGGNSAEACRALEQSVAGWSITHAIRVVAISETAAARSSTTCAEFLNARRASHAGGVPVDLVARARLPRDSVYVARPGFCVVDSAGRVIYGSRLFRDVAGLSDVLRFFRPRIASWHS